MSTIEKLIARFKTKPRDFSWEELTRILYYFGYVQIKGSGSRRKFVHEDYQTIKLYQPHPQNILKKYQIDHVCHILEERKFL